MTDTSHPSPIPASRSEPLDARLFTIFTIACLVTAGLFGLITS
jgi:hypothetical protein